MKRSATTKKRHSSEFVLQDISARVHSRNRSHDFGKKAIINTNSNDNNKKLQFFQEIKTLEDRLDDVDVEISHNLYALAVGLIAHIENKLHQIESSLLLSTTTTTTKQLGDEQLLLDVSRLKIKNRKESIQLILKFDLTHNISKLTESDIENILTYFDSFDQLQTGIQTYLDSMSSYLSTTISRLIVGLQGSTKIDVVNYLSNLVVIYVAILKRTIETYNHKIMPLLKKNNGNVDSSGLINWCIEEVLKLSRQVNKHLYGTMVTSTSNGLETDQQPVYVIKDRVLYDDFVKILVPQLGELKRVGINVDYIFEPIMSLS